MFQNHIIKSRYKQMQLKIAAMRIYLCISYQVNYDTFYKKLDMPDVMYSFCLVTFFHVWMVSVALMQYGHSGLFVRKCLHEFMWKDIETRAKKLQATMNKEIKLKTYQHLNDVFRGHLFGFDEGLLSFQISTYFTFFLLVLSFYIIIILFIGLLGDDTVLAGAVWRHLFEMKEIKDYAILGEMCDYIRKNVDHLENISDKDLLSNGIISLLDFNQKKLDHSQVRPKIYEMIRKKESE